MFTYAETKVPVRRSPPASYILTIDEDFFKGQSRAELIQYLTQWVTRHPHTSVTLRYNSRGNLDQLDFLREHLAIVDFRFHYRDRYSVVLADKLTNFIKNLPALRQFRAYVKNLPFDEDFARALARLPTLEEVLLDVSSLTMNALRFLQRFPPSLYRLSLTVKKPLTDQIAEQLGRVLASARLSYVTLNLTASPLGWDMIGAALAYNPYVISFTVPTFYKDPLAMLAQLPSMQNLCRLELKVDAEYAHNLKVRLSKLTSLRTLKLHLRDPQIGTVAECLPVMPNLRRLFLENSQIDNESVEKFVPLLPTHCARLEELSLAQNNLSNRGVKTLSSSLAKLTHLTHLDVSSNLLSDFADLPKLNLLSLDLSNTDYYPLFPRKLTNALLNNHSITEFASSFVMSPRKIQKRLECNKKYLIAWVILALLKNFINANHESKISRSIAPLVPHLLALCDLSHPTDRVLRATEICIRLRFFNRHLTPAEKKAEHQHHSTARPGDPSLRSR